MLPDTDILSSELRDIFRKLDTSNLSEEEMLQLANGCEDHIAGLCHGLHFLGKTFVSFADSDVLEFSRESLCQLGHGLKATATLLPALMELHQMTERNIAAEEYLI
ncbi:hypothetical protein [Kosakonia sacchari]|uniref:hypothetical protein n=1 Tax=Kosakonia sacchari TaxID=1158459 RepID=UPI00158531A6|nr:hypothetical protein [Kosakonia sacchari]NUL35993.1 hypothetical protein [Kosakonia sacchari]